MKGKFITFEGCEGAGKSTQLRFLSAYLAERGVPHIVTREPGGSSISEAIRKVILDGRFTAMTDECEALLYAAARAQHLADTVLPALEAGKTVLCDRYLFSSFAYQGYGRGLPRRFLLDINSYAVGRCMPTSRCFWTSRPRARSSASTAPTATTASSRRGRTSTTVSTRGTAASRRSIRTRSCASTARAPNSKRRTRSSACCARAD